MQELDTSLETIIETMADIHPRDHHSESMVQPFSHALQAIRYAYQTEVEQVNGQPAQDFLPEPNHWKHILKLPKKTTTSLVKEPTSTTHPINQTDDNI